MSKKEWKALGVLADNRSIFIKQAKKGSCVVAWCRDDYMKEPNKQFADKTVYKDINFKETILLGLVDKSNMIFKNLYTRKFVMEKEQKNDFKKATNLAKWHILSNIHKQIYNVPRRPAISNCGTPTVLIFI